MDTTLSSLGVGRIRSLHRLGFEPIAAIVLLAGGLVWGVGHWVKSREHAVAMRQVEQHRVRVAINQNIVSGTARRLHMDPALLLAVAKVESDFREHVESDRGAKGIMQVREATGREIANYLGMVEWDLFNAEDCSLIGGAYLKDLLRLYRQDMHLALAAYHAGPLIVDEWVHQSDGLPGEQIVETFGYRSTRMYVKDVIREADRYRRTL